MRVFDFIADPFRIFRSGNRAFEGGAGNQYQLRAIKRDAEWARAHQYDFDSNVHFLKEHISRPVNLGALDKAFNRFDDEFRKELARIQEIGNRSLRLFYAYEKTFYEIKSLLYGAKVAYYSVGQKAEWDSAWSGLSRLEADFKQVAVHIKHEGNNLSAGNIIASVQSWSHEGSRTVERHMKAKVNFARQLDNEIYDKIAKVHDRFNAKDSKVAIILVNELVVDLHKMFDVLFELNHSTFILIHRYGDKLKEISDELGRSKLKDSPVPEGQKSYNYMNSKISELKTWYSKYKEAYFRLAETFANSQA